jgi:hypothetical protein
MRAETRWQEQEGYKSRELDPEPIPGFPGPCERSFILNIPPTLEVSDDFVLGDSFCAESHLQAGCSFLESCPLCLRPLPSGRDVVANCLTVAGDGYRCLVLQEIAGKLLLEFSNPDSDGFHLTGSLG